MTKPKFDTVIFDLDGTLADTLADLAASVNHALAEQGLPGYPTDDYRHFVGNGVDNLMRTVLADNYTPELLPLMKESFSAYYAGHCLDYTADYPGIAELLSRLDDDGITTAVISNKPDRFVPDILGHIYPDHRFAYAWGQQPDVERKPSPQALDKLIELLGADKSRVLYVGDSNVDVVFAHNAGVKVCGVSWGFRGVGELREAGADYIVYSAEELYSIITKK